MYFYAGREEKIKFVQGKIHFLIVGYVVEKCEEGSDLWDKVPGVVTKNSQVVKGLVPGKKYNFRVRAENRLGLGEPVETNKAILAKNPYGKINHVLLRCISLIECGYSQNV